MSGVTVGPSNTVVPLLGSWLNYYGTHNLAVYGLLNPPTGTDLTATITATSAAFNGLVADSVSYSGVGSFGTPVLNQRRRVFGKPDCHGDLHHQRHPVLRHDLRAFRRYHVFQQNVAAETKRHLTRQVLQIGDAAGAASVTFTGSASNYGGAQYLRPGCRCGTVTANRHSNRYRIIGICWRTSGYAARHPDCSLAGIGSTELSGTPLVSKVILTPTGIPGTETVGAPTLTQTAAGPLINVTNHLNANQNSIIQFLGDSTVNGYGDSDSPQQGYPGRVGVQLGTFYNVGTVTQQLATYGPPYGSATTDYTGAGSNTIQILNGGWDGGYIAEYISAGMSNLLPVTNPDCIIIGTGINDMGTHGDSPAQFATDMQAFIGDIQTRCPGVPIVVTTQNAYQLETFSNYTNMITAVLGFAASIPMTPVLQKSTAYTQLWVLDTAAAFNYTFTQSLMYDSLHPNSAGYDLEASWILAQLAPSVLQQVFPAGVGSSETSGAPVISLTQTVAPAGICSLESVGAPARSSVAFTAPVGVGSLESVGAPARSSVAFTAPVGVPSGDQSGVSALTQIILPAGIGSAETVGAPARSSVAFTAPTGIPTTEQSGAPAATPGAVTIAPPGIGSGETSGAAAIAIGAVTVTPAGIGSIEAAGPPTVTKIITPAGTTSGELFGTTVGTLYATPAGIGTSESFGTPSAFIAQSVYATGITTTELFGAPTATPGPVTVTPVGVGTGEQTGAPAAAKVATPAGIGTAETAGAPTLTRIIASAGIGSSEAAGAATAVPGPVAVAPVGTSTAETFGAPTVTAPAVGSISPAGIPGAETSGAATAAPGPVTVAPAGTPSGEQAGAPTAAKVATPVGVSTAEAVGAALTAKVIAPAGISSTELFGTTVGTLYINPVGITTTEQLGPAVFAPTLLITPTGIPGSDAVGKPAVTPGAVTITPAGIGGTELFGTPTGTLYLGFKGVGTTEQFGQPLAALALLINPKGIPGLEAVGKPTLSWLITPVGINTTETLGTTALLALQLAATGINTAELFGWLIAGTRIYQTPYTRIATPTDRRNNTPTDQRTATPTDNRIGTTV